MIAKGKSQSQIQTAKNLWNSKKILELAFVKQLCKYACRQLCGYADTGMQVCKYASNQVCKEIQELIFAMQA